MSAKRIAIVILGVAAVALLAAYSLRLVPARDATAGPQREVARETADGAKEVTGASDEGVSLETPSQPDSNSSEESTNAGTSLAYERPLSWFEMNIGRNYEDCRSKRLAMDVCKQWFEPRDQRWASETEQRIDELVSATPILRLSTNDKIRLPNVECRTTWCRIFLDVDVPALIEQRRSVGQWDDNSRHKFFDATLARGWDKDRAEELRLGLAMSGLIEDDAEIEVHGAVLASGEPDAFLEVFVHRCPKRYESCGPR